MVQRRRRFGFLRLTGVHDRQQSDSPDHGQLMIALGALTLVPDMTLPIVVEFDRALVTWTRTK